MKLKSIDIHIFKILLSNKEITLTEIVGIYNESERNIKLSLNRLNNFLIKFSYGEIIKENNHYMLNLISNNISNKTLSYFPNLSFEERMNYLLIQLAFEKKINTVKIAKYFDVTRNTLSSDIKTLKNKLLQYNLTLESIPWKGLYLKGSYKDVYIFSIKIILKFLVKKELNSTIYSIYEKMINPAIRDYYSNFITQDVDYEFSKLSISILKYFNIEMDLYGKNTLKAIFIFLTLNQDDMIPFKNSDIFKEKYLLLKKDYNKIYNELIDSKLLSDKKNLINNMEFLVISIVILQKRFLILEIEKNTPLIIDEIENIFNIEFTTDDKIEFITLLDIANFNYEYDIHNYHKIPKNNFKFPEFLIDILKKCTLKYNYKILSQDFYILAHFLYNLIFNTYLKFLINKKILILDYSNNNWISANIKSKLRNNFKFKNIDTLSVYLLESINPDILETYDFIIYSSYSDIATYFDKLDSLKKKIIILDYLDYFEVSYLINRLLFNKCIFKEK